MYIYMYIYINYVVTRVESENTNFPTVLQLIHTALRKRGAR